MDMFPATLLNRKTIQTHTHTHTHRRGVMVVHQPGPEEANMKWYGHSAVKHPYRAIFATFGVQEALTLLFMIS